MFNTTASRIAGIGVALGVALLAAKYWRPVVKGAIKAYLAASDSIKEGTAGAGGGIQDLYAEAKAEHESARKAARQAAQQAAAEAGTQAQ